MFLFELPKPNPQRLKKRRAQARQEERLDKIRRKKGAVPARCARTPSGLKLASRPDGS